jgi:hypothetical protein
MKNFLPYLLLVINSIAFSQEKMVLDTTDYPKRQAFIKEFENSNLQLIQTLEKSQDRKVYKMLKKNMEEFKTDFSKEIKEQNFHFDERLETFLNTILTEFKDKNPEIPQNTKILVSKNTNLNAYCLPDGTFVINLGLLYWLDNEDQIAGVLAHEISHKVLDHSIKTQVNLINDQLNENNKNLVTALKKQKFNKTEKAFQLFKNKLYATGEMRKKHEFEADSLGYLFLKKTKYNKLDYIETLRLIEKYDTIKPRGLSKTIYKKTFEIPNHPFKEEWLKMEDFSNYDYSLLKEKINLDSIASHPEIDDRIKKLEQLYPELKASKSDAGSENFKKLEQIAYYNIIPNLMFSEDYGAAIYICLNRIENEKQVELHKKQLGECFHKVYVARKEYKLNRYLDRIDPKNQSESYMQFLSFMWNLSLDDIKNIAEFYSK